MANPQDIQFEEIFKEYKYSNDIDEYGKDLGKGSFGVVKDVKIKNKSYAGKLVMKDVTEEIRLTQELRGPNIIRIQKICKPKVKNNATYHLVIMEKAILRDLGKLNNYYHEHNLLKLKLDYPFDEQMEDTLLRYYARQIIDGLEILNRNNFVHFDIKPDNILITVNLILKLSDFSILRRVDDGIEDFKIPGGTPGYLTPEYYLTQKLSPQNTRTQDYFALGATLFLLKFGKSFLKYKKYDDKKIIADRIVDLLLRNRNYINKQRLIDENLIYFLLGLVNSKPEERLNFEQIYRNKWLNKNVNYLDNVVTNFETDEEKLLIELLKQDFIVKKIEINEYNTCRAKKISYRDGKEKEKEKINKNFGKKFKFKKKDLTKPDFNLIRRIMNQNK